VRHATSCRSNQLLTLQLAKDLRSLVQLRRQRNGNDFTKRFPLVVATVAALPVRSCLNDGEAVVSDDSGLAVFELIRSWHEHLGRALRLRPA
jgi:hypothetical protein